MGGGETTSKSETTYGPAYDAQLAAATAKANEVANQPFSQYEGDRVAGLSPDTLAAMEIARGTIGSQDPIYDEAGSLLSQSGAYDPVATATQLLEQYGRPDDYSGLDTANPALYRATDYLDASSADYTNDILNSTGANQRFTSSVDDYMSPYTTAVVDEIARRGNQNLAELLPSVNKTFIGGGVFGGSQNRDLVGRTIRDAQNNILGQQANALEAGYSEAGNLFNQDQNRLSGQASTLGTLAANDYGRAATGYQNIGKTQADLGNQDADRRMESTKYLTGLGTQDQLSKERLAGLLQDYGSNYNKANLQDAAILEGIGSTQQQQEQAQINADIQKYLEQKNYGQSQLETLSYPLQTFKFPSTTTQTQSQSSDPFGQILGTLMGGASIASGAGAFKKKGGRVNPLSYASGGGVNNAFAIGELLKNIFGGGDSAAREQMLQQDIAAEDGLSGMDGVLNRVNDMKNEPVSNSGGLFSGILDRPAVDTGGYNPVGPQAFDVPMDDFLKKLKLGGGNPLAYADGGGVSPEEEILNAKLRELFSGIANYGGLPNKSEDNFPKNDIDLKAKIMDLPSLVPENVNPVAMGRAIDASSPDAAFNAIDVMQDPAAQKIPKRSNPLAQNIAASSPAPVANPIAAPVVTSEPSEVDKLNARVKELMDNKDDKFRSQLLRAGIGLMSPGSFGTQLQQGFKGYADAGDAYDAQRIKGYNDLTGTTLREGELGRKTANDQLDNLIAEQRIAALGGKTDKSDTERMKQRVKYISDSAITGKDADAAAAEFDTKIWPSGGVVIPQRNIAKALGVGDVVKGYRFKGGDTKDKNNWEKAN